MCVDPTTKGYGWLTGGLEINEGMHLASPFIPIATHLGQYGNKGLGYVS